MSRYVGAACSRRSPRPTVYKAAIGCSRGLCINHLQRLPAPSLAHHGTITAQPIRVRHVSGAAHRHLFVWSARCTGAMMHANFSTEPMPCADPQKGREGRLKVRLTRQAKSVLERAASIERKTVGAFILDKGLAAAAETMADRREFILSAKHYDAFVAALDATEEPRPRVEHLLKTPSVLE